MSEYEEQLAVMTSSDVKLLRRALEIGYVHVVAHIIEVITL